jgi:N-acetylglucosaminyl-diphospho-decaprenol L-rhamnosyltransferase
MRAGFSELILANGKLRAMDETMTIDLSIIIVSWNVRDLLRKCLASINAQRESLALQVIVVDGASHDGSAAMVREEFPWVELIAAQLNLGFPRGNNLGISAATGRSILLLNPDTAVLPGALHELIYYLDCHPEVGVVGPQLLNVDGSVQSSRRRFPTFLTGLFESTWAQSWAPAGLMRRYYALDVPDNEVADVDWVIGACMMVQRHVVDEVGVLDDEYFMYSEELDWCRRIKDAGWRVVYYPEAQVTHHVGQSSDQVVTARHIHYQQAKLRYFRKYHGRFATAALRVFLLLNYAWQMGLETIKGMAGHKPPLRRQRARSYWEVLRTGLRPAGF